MTLEEAITKLKEGHRIKRESIDSIRCFTIDGKLFEFVYKDGRQLWTSWTISVDDLLAMDYVLVP